MVPSTAQQAYDQAAEAFTARNPKSKVIFARATESLPGGNTRTSVFYQPFPVSINRAEGAKLYDEDGHEYIDFLGEFTAGLYGHSEPAIIHAITKALQRGLNFGSRHEDEGQLAALVKQRFPSMELLRFTNSGTEANLMALAAATAYTGKKKIMVFAGAYHGGAFIFKDGKSSTVNAPYNYVIARYNDTSSVEQLLRSPENDGNVAAIVVEPMIGSGGAIAAEHDFLKGLRRAATDASAMLIFDEVMTSRMHEGGGIQSQLSPDMKPDITTLGKYIGGGMSFGAFGGRRAIMDLFDPRKPNSLAHAGTFNNNVLTMTAGKVGLTQIFTPEVAKSHHAKGDELRASLQEASRGTLMKITGYGSIMCFHFTRIPVENIKSPQDAQEHNSTLGGIFHLFLLDKGYYISRRGFFALSLALTDEDLKGFIDVVKDFLESHKSLLSLDQHNSTINGH